jgi:hypothetical protein
MSQVIATFFAGCLVVLSALQAGNFIATERAFVAPSSTDFAVQETVGVKQLPMLLELRNSGKNTATIEELTAGITHQLPPEPIYFEAQKFAFAPIIPGGSTKRILPFETNWGEATANGVKTGSLPFYIFGRIRYSDSFSWIMGFKETGFCFIHTPGSPIAPFETCLERAFTYTSLQRP